ncbi:MAG: STIV orfB116 family protein [Pyrobaculum sp.]|jgi:integrase
METNQNQIPVALVNAFSVSMFDNPRRLLVEFRRLTIEELQQLTQGAPIQSYIRHQGTVQLISQLLGREIQASNSLYVYTSERIVMFVLQTPQRGAEIQQLRPEDIVIYEVVVHSLE